ncbi:hypothetical protein E2F43_11745 [Seongchinamella unica]|uniref:Uncharacterized protein n=1 Tax=Seongchinamella unica TaxID=2547392 RepID=A0A4R5LTA5_9GAMM|nr:hypothetical protein [Seongchinamella unica]TDG14140.1 hypothetical protein E2F43_11745 [Seongchinamella unica]
MVKQVALRTVGVLAMVGAGAVWGHGDQNGTVVYIYEGEISARDICMSIVYDDVHGLKHALRHERRTLLERSHLLYECNDMGLDEFAFTMGAEDVSQYLAPKFGREGVVTVEQVGSIND